MLRLYSTVTSKRTISINGEVIFQNVPKNRYLFFSRKLKVSENRRMLLHKFMQQLEEIFKNLPKLLLGVVIIGLLPEWFEILYM